jgi:hypothetical protein
MIEFTPEQRRELKATNGTAGRAIDPDTGQEYILVRAEVYERLRSALGDRDDFVDATYPAVMEVFAREGWDDASMDVYNDLDPRNQK